MEKYRCVILETQSRDWQMLYIDDKLIKEDRCLTYGKNGIFFILNYSEMYTFQRYECVCRTLEDEDSEVFYGRGRGHQYLSDYISDYSRMLDGESI